MNAEQIISEIEWLEQLFSLSDDRSQISEWKAARQTHYEKCTKVSGFRLPRLEWLEQLFMLLDNRLGLPI
jgi:hypothetical protein